MNRKRTAKAAGIRLSALLIMLAGLTLYWFFERDTSQPLVNPSVKTASLASTGVLFEFGIEDKADFYVTEKGDFFFCTKDGIKFYDSLGQHKWERVFNMLEPILVGEGEMAAAAEHGGKVLYVFNSSGPLYSLQFDYPITSFSINRTGYAAVILQKENDKYDINVYDGNSTTEPCWRRGNEDYGVFPLACDVSDDGKYVALSLLDINDVVPASKILFCHIKKTDSNQMETDTIFYGSEKSDQLVGIMKFMDNGMLIAVSDSGIFGMEAVNDTVLEKWTLEFNNQLDKISYNSGKGFAIALGKGLINKSSEPVGTIKYYNIKGENKFDVSGDGPASFLWAGQDSLLIGNGTGWKVLDTKGRQLWEYQAPYNVTEIMLLNSTNDVLMISGNKAEIMKRD